ncbi:ead/Ea22-like family protein [Citrobacter sedlakii]|uniref:ead/Ea22-like family protein n=1 Tax=unclassified Citrobacter TaxID=2644389 RepID=UPI0015E936F4|nr:MULTISPECIES: ead/Ea22-like family protein [Citrobacter]MBN6597028.1 ead/Ea22-like family protein [Citrobacter sedlakii]QMK46499.1 ead/Ea22-like family protein [Citrobacter sp. RHB21-C05]QMK64942.1 ead/Ea22-like family protein [Citrobacter sp. RHB21-C01]
MTDKQALRLTAEKAKDNFMPNFMVPTRDVLALLDELDSANGYASAYEAEKWHYHGLAESEGERADRAEKQVEELTMWIKRLAHSLRNARPDSKLHGAAMDYLSRNGLISVEDVLR